MLRELLKKATGKKKGQDKEASTSQPKADSTAAKKAPASSTAASKPAASKKAPSKASSTAKPAAKKAAAKKAVSKAPAKKAAAKKATAKKAVAKKPASKPASKAPVAEKKTSTKATTVKAATPKKAAASKPPAAAKKATASRKTASKTKKAVAAAPQTKAPLPKANKPAQPRNHVPAQVSRPVNKTSSTTMSQAMIHGFKPYQPAEGEEYMNEAQREHFRQILLAWRLQLMEEADRTMHHLQDEQANLPDPADRATQEEEFALELRTRDRERKLLKKIEKVLDKIKKDDFGYCEACGIEIGIRRLEARPTADMCIDCKELAEIKEKQLAG